MSEERTPGTFIKSTPLANGGSLVCASDMVEKNGRTIRENNLEIRHNIPVGTLVEVKFSEWHGGGACERTEARLWVIGHGRDCDGTPLYCLSADRDAELYERPGLYAKRVKSGFSEESLKPIEVTDDLEYGHGALDWDEDESI